MLRITVKKKKQTGQLYSETRSVISINGEEGVH